MNSILWPSLMDTLGTLTEAYEDRHFPEPVGDPISTLAFFIEDHGVSRGDLPEIGSPTEVAEILNRKRELTLQQIHSLSNRFNVSPEVFLYERPLNQFTPKNTRHLKESFALRIITNKAGPRQQIFSAEQEMEGMLLRNAD